ncbi:MAG: Glu/Leu/Phe/Val dehydrogenase [bacterium]|nr:Glu/Leu/Phe/Val dehydrogenase [bacterium]
MALIPLGKMKNIMNIPKPAEVLLTKSEKEIKFSLNLKTADDIICYDAFVVYHNVVMGPAKGGVRFSPRVSLEETRKLAEIMTYKNALMGLPFGGGKSGIQFDPYKVDDFTRIAIVKEYVHMIREELYTGAYIPAPDMGSTPYDMAVIYGETHIPESVTGKPVIVGGLPGRLQATGRGVSYAVKLGCEKLLKMSLKDAKVVIQGFGNVGRWTAYFLNEMGAKIIAVQDIGGAIYNNRGLDIDELFKYCPTSKDTVKGFPEAEDISPDDFFSLKCDAFVPAALESVITENTAPELNTKMVVEGANDPTTEEGENILLNRDIIVLPDFFANSGGVIASYIEWRNAKSGNQTSEEEVYEIIDSKIENTFFQALKKKEELKCKSLREAFFALALNSLIEAMRARLWI